MMVCCKFLSLIGFALLTLPGHANAIQEDDASKNSINKLAWLAGSWSGEQGRSQTEEHWLTPAGGMMLATNRTVNGDKGFFEFLRIQQRGDSLSYFASPAGRPAIEFKLKEISDRRVVFENLNNDFPQRIIYQREGDDLNVSIEGEAEGQIRRTNWTWKREK